MAALASHAAEGNIVSVYADGKRGDAEYDRAKAKPYVIKRFGGIKLLRQRRKARAAQAYAAQHDNAQIFCDSWRSAEYLPASLPCPVTVYAHGNEYPRESEASFKTKLPRIRRALSKVNVLIAVSRHTQARAEPFIPKTCRAHVIHNPVEPALTPSATQIASAAALWPDADKTRCLVLCRLVEMKGVDMVIRAVAAHEDCQLVIAGSGPDLPRLRALIAQLGIESRAVFAGRVEGGEKSALFSSADIFLQPGRRIGDYSEGYGLTYLEAALHGLPSISGNQGGAPEAVSHDETGFIVDGADPVEVMEALGRLLEDEALRQRLGEAAKRRAQSQLWPRKIDSILTLAYDKDERHD